MTFSEWGWEVASREAVFYERDFDDLLELVEAGIVSGHMFWSWNDVNQFTRKDWAAYNGVLMSGAVTESRELREPIYSRLAALFNGRREVPNAAQRVADRAALALAFRSRRVAAFAIRRPASAGRL